MAGQIEPRAETPPARALLVLGAHRSGAAGLARVCGLLGADLIATPTDNRIGDQGSGIADIHDDILARLESRWDDPRALPPRWWEREDLHPCRARLEKTITRELGKSRLWAVGDPRLCRLVPLWRDVLAGLAVQALPVLIVRPAGEVVSALGRCAGLAPERSVLLWLRYNLEAERATRGATRAWVSYHDLLGDGQGAMGRVGETLGIDWPIPPGEAGSAISVSLRREPRDPAPMYAGPLDDERLRGWVMRLEGILLGERHAGKLDELAGEIEAALGPADGLVSACYRDYLASQAALQRAEAKLDQATLECERQTEEIGALNEQLDRTRTEIGELEWKLSHAERDLRAYAGSTSWRITAPLRRLARMLGATRAIGARLYAGVVDGWPARGTAGAGEPSERAAPRAGEYARWIGLYDTLGPGERSAIARHIEGFRIRPRISVIMPVYDVEEEWLRQAIDSVLAQLYPDWELCIADDCSTRPHVARVLREYQARDPRIRVTYREANGHISECSNSALGLASGDYVALLDDDDRLAEHALYFVASEINEHPEADLIYSDEDKIDTRGKRYDPYFKSDWNPDLFYGQNMFSHLGVYRRSLVEEAGGFRAGFEGSQDYDLCLRALARTCDERVRHIPRILYHWRAIPGSTATSGDSKGYAAAAARKAVAEHLRGREPRVRVIGAKGTGYQRVIWPLPDPEPRVSLVVPTRNRCDLLRICIDSISERTDYRAYEIVVVNNQSDEPETLAYLEQLGARPRVRVLDFDRPYNFSAINNFAAARCDAEVLGFVNNDIEAIDGGWLREMVSHAMRPEVGAVGAKLLYPDDTVQHGGIITGAGAPVTPVGSHLFHRLHRDAGGYFGRALLTQAVSGCTAACLVMRRAVLDEIGGFEERHLTVAFNDVDLCLRLRARGYRIVWTPFAELYHRESASRGYEDSPEKQDRFRGEVMYMRTRWTGYLDDDPYYSPNLRLVEGDFGLAFPPRVQAPWEASSPGPIG